MKRAALWLPLLLAGIAAAAPQLDRGAWRAAGLLATGRYAPAATRLPDGRVLLAGGYSFEADGTHATTEVFDPRTGAWNGGPVMRFDRNFPLALDLPDGDVLFVAGFRGGAGTTATTERLHPQSLTFANEAAFGAPPAIEERELFSAVRLLDGRWLITGGYSTLRRKTLDSAEIYDPDRGEFHRFASGLHHPRFGHTAVLLADGRALIVGGKVLATNDDVLPAELFDPLTNAFTDTGSLRVGRDRCTAWTLPRRRGEAERVMVVGGSAKEGGTVPARRTEIYDAANGCFTDGPELIRDRMAHTATPLGKGRVLLVGGWCNSEGKTTRQAELWDPKTASFVSAGQLEHGRHDHAAVLLEDGRVLVAGGKEAPARNGVESPLETEIWSPHARPTR
jgi:hypothetical protein